MLTKTDLSQIQSIVQTETKIIVQKELAPIKKDIKIIKKNINMIIEVFDEHYLGLRARVDRIEDHLGFTAFPS